MLYSIDYLIITSKEELSSGAPYIIYEHYLTEAKAGEYYLYIKRIKF